MGLRIRKKVKSRQVVFVSDQPRSREAKLAFGLKENGWEVILLHSNTPSFDATLYFKEIHHYDSLDNLLKLANRYRPTVYHVLSNWNFNAASTLIQQKPGKIVFDDYDVMAGMVKEEIVNKLYPGQYALEKYCLENADGLCCRSLETQYAKRYKGYKYHGKRILFPDLCWNTYHKVNKESVRNEFNVANSGNLYIDSKFDIDHSRNFHLKLALNLAHHNITSYLYKAPYDRELFKSVSVITENTPYIHLKNLGVDELLSEISKQCHAGLVCAPQQITLRKDEIYCQTKREFAIGNKAFDYVDGRMPIIMDSENKFLFWLIKRYSKVIDFQDFITHIDQNIEEIKNHISNNEVEMDQAVEKLSVSRHIPRLTRFYESI